MVFAGEQEAYRTETAVAALRAGRIARESMMNREAAINKEGNQETLGQGVHTIVTFKLVAPRKEELQSVKSQE